MFEPNVQRVLDQIKPTDVVLDIGGWARPFNRANYVMDAEPYATRGYYGIPAQGGDTEHFTKHTWITRDICDKEPFPFGDKELDYVTCSHTLEDIRDPLYVCSEMIRVAKRGYIEIPSRLMESCRGIEGDIVGWSHHRWLIDIVGDHISFLMKYHRIHLRKRYSFPESLAHSLSEEQKVQWLFWESDFAYSERTIHGANNVAAELERYVAETHPYPAWWRGADMAFGAAESFNLRVKGKLRRTLQGWDS